MTKKPKAPKAPATLPPFALQVTAFFALWHRQMPAEAADGVYTPNARTDLAAQHLDIPDGVYASRESPWHLRFAGGRFVQAVRSDRAAAFPIGAALVVDA